MTDDHARLQSGNGIRILNGVQAAELRWGDEMSSAAAGSDGQGGP